MGSAKYTVYADNHFLGNYPGHTAEIAVKKAIQKHWPFRKSEILNTKNFKVYRGFNDYLFSWDTLPFEKELF